MIDTLRVLLPNQLDWLDRWVSLIITRYYQLSIIWSWLEEKFNLMDTIQKAKKKPLVEILKYTKTCRMVEKLVFDLIYS